MKTKISEYSATAASNTDINGIDIAEGCAPSGINDAIRTLMSDLKDWQAGTSGDLLAIAAGGTNAATTTAALQNLGGTTTGIDLFKSTDASAARSVLGVSLGVDVQAFDANLTTFVSVFTLPTTDGTEDQVLKTNGSGILSFETPTADIPEIKTPTNVSPASGATDIGATPTLTGSTYYSLYGITMAAGQWQVSTASDFSTTVVNTGDVAGTSVSYAVGSGILSVSTVYYWRVRYKDANGTYSDWSTGTSFTTAASFGPSVFGEAYGGGFYAGKIVQGGSTYYLVVAPKSSGESSSKQWKTTNDAGPTATQTLNNGPAASSAMNSASYPAAQFCEGLSIGGFTDWYMPARDELELCYRNLKPTTTSNSTSARSLSGITYSEGNDVSGDTMGINRNSNPTGAAYTSGSPAQTSVTAFQTGGAEAFAADDYWSSSEFSATGAWRQNFHDGNQGSRSKGYGHYVRAVRRIAV